MYAPVDRIESGRVEEAISGQDETADDPASNDVTGSPVQGLVRQVTDPFLLLGRTVSRKWQMALDKTGEEETRDDDAADAEAERRRANEDDAAGHKTTATDA